MQEAGKGDRRVYQVQETHIFKITHGVWTTHAQIRQLSLKELILLHSMHILTSIKANTHTLFKLFYPTHTFFYAFAVGMNWKWIVYAFCCLLGWWEWEYDSLHYMEGNIQI